jgi:hypothetical protein
MITGILQTALTLVGKLKDHMKTIVTSKIEGKADSLISVSQAARVEPICLVDQRLSNLPYLTDAVQVLSSIFIGYYLQAVALSVKVGRVNTLKLLDTLNPNRDSWGAMMELQDEVMGTVSKESFEHRLPVIGELSLGLEDIKEPKKKDDKVQEPLQMKAGINPMIQESANLCVGKVVEVTIEDNGVKAMFPISVRLISSITDARVLLHILADNSRTNTSAAERIHGWRSGQLEFWRDLILCQDLIAEHRATLMRDGTDAYATILNRRTNNNAATLMTGRPSLGTASNLMVISSETVKEVEREIGGKLSSFNVRQKIFNSTYLMIMMVIDPEWESVTIYHNGISMGSQLPVKELKGANKGNGPDVGEILKAYQLGNSPTI